MNTQEERPSKTIKNTRYYLAALTAFTIWGFFSLVLKPIHDHPSVDILFYRVFSCAILMLVITLFFRRSILVENLRLFKSLPSREKRKYAGLNIGGAVFLTANWFSFIYVMNHISVKATSLAYLICPVLTALLARFILKEKLDNRQWLAISLSLAGCILLSYANLIDMAYSLIIGLSYALYLVSQRENKGFDKAIVLTFQMVCSAILLLPFYPVYSTATPATFKFYFYIELIAIGFTIIPLFLNLYALKGINSSTAGMLLNINPIIAFLLAVFFYHEPINTIQIIAYGIIFLSVLIFNARIFYKKNKDV